MKRGKGINSRIENNIMIYLIGGAPRVGKSTIAKQFADSIKAKFISTDDLEDQDNRQPSVIFHSDHHKNSTTPAKRIKSVINEAQKIISDITEIIDKVIGQSQNIVIEGVHLLPVYIDKLISKYGRDRIKVIIIGSTDTELILEGMISNTSPNNWSKGFNKKVLRQITIFTKSFSEYLIDESKKYNLRYKERSSDFHNDVCDIIKELIIS